MEAQYDPQVLSGGFLGSGRNTHTKMQPLLGIKGPTVVHLLLWDHAVLNKLDSGQAFDSGLTHV